VIYLCSEYPGTFQYLVFEYIHLHFTSCLFPSFFFPNSFIFVFVFSLSCMLHISPISTSLAWSPYFTLINSWRHVRSVQLMIFKVCPSVCYFLSPISKYSYAPYNDVSINVGPHIRRWSHNILIL